MTLRAIFFGATRCFVKGIPEKFSCQKAHQYRFQKTVLTCMEQYLQLEIQTALGNNSPFSIATDFYLFSRRW